MKLIPGCIAFIFDKTILFETLRQRNIFLSFWRQAVLFFQLVLLIKISIAAVSLRRLIIKEIEAYG